MRFLVIGGTSFIGLHVVGTALERGHEVTLFNRGLTNPHAFTGVEELTGDRTNPRDLEQLAGRDWDAVVDTCGFDFRVVEQSSDLLRGHVGHYTFISSIAVYADFSHPNREDDAKVDLPDELVGTQRAYGGSSLYGPMKVQSERIIRETFPGGWLAVRPTAVAGPGDHGASTRRMAYWGQRVRDYDEILVPGPSDRLVAYVDVRDLASWIVAMAERSESGAFNAAAPALSIDAFLDVARRVYETDARAVYVDPDWLLAQGVQMNVEIPWWLAGDERRYALAVDGSSARAAGLESRPLEGTLLDSVAWEEIRPPYVEHVPRSAFAGQAPGSSLTRARELELLDAWRRRD